MRRFLITLQILGGVLLLAVASFARACVSVYVHRGHLVLVVSRVWHPLARPWEKYDGILFAAFLIAGALLVNPFISLWSQRLQGRWPQRVWLGVLGVLAALTIASVMLGPPIKARKTWSAEPCENNIRQIMGAKEAYLYEHGAPPGGEFPSEDLSQYIKGGLEHLNCPLGGHYDIGGVEETPACSEERARLIVKW